MFLNTYFSSIGSLIEGFIECRGFDVCLIPHVPHDLQGISQLLSILPERHKREHVVVAPYLTGNHGAHAIFSIYRESSLILGNRFHTNVCAVAMGAKSLGIAVLDRIKNLYEKTRF